MTFLEPSKPKVPPSAKYGDPKLSVPVNGDPLLHVTTTCATTVPTGVVAGMDGFGGLNEMDSVGGGGTVGDSVAYIDQWNPSGPLGLAGKVFGIGPNPPVAHLSSRPLVMPLRKDRLSLLGSATMQ